MARKQRERKRSAELMLKGLGRPAADEEGAGSPMSSDGESADAMESTAPNDSDAHDDSSTSNASSVATRGPAMEEPARRDGLARARSAYEQGRTEEAIQAYLSVVRLNPADVAVRVEVGDLYDHMGEHEQAVAQYRAAQQEDPENPEIMTRLGTALGAAGRFDEAEAELRRAIRLAPDSLDVRAGLGILFFRKGLYEQADTELRAVCLRDGEHGPAHFYRGEALTRLSDYDEAIRSLERAVEIQPWNARAHYLLGILFDRKYLHDRAAAMYRRARELNDR